MRMNILCMSILIVGCGQQPQQGDPRSIHGIDPAFQPYVEQFETILGHSIGDIPIAFAPQQGDVIGVCELWTNYRDIKIDPNFWNNQGGALDNDQRMSLIFHELGHCVLDRGHLATDWTYNLNGWNYSVPTSFMNPYIFFSAQYPVWVALKSYYINELFHPAPGAPTLYNSMDLVDHYGCVKHMDTDTNINH
jgi:hypothetical protein